MSKKLYVGVDLGGTNVKSGLVDEDGNVLARDERKTLARCRKFLNLYYLPGAAGLLFPKSGVSASVRRGR